ncbi:50S ribosomal protein L22 [Candidatus Desantisbacteria bacterium CG1_02_38_46]|uniref:Large ribosomal subunit protein uL22 n=3 Tax=unclassified Candidatus Desantisiibacteriota TaxID=3106372 RepID=A0A2H9PCI1_9BACT|nr:ribosomal protein L22 [uncultured bacterium]OIN97488.1 MAG: 50S ribosomal protein L22 [Candidatus Desantisbacteria bacterium CG1_02_38_46]PIU51319.1 MAG: 50S ribosomal protein L22 [Candidatus Desantisbacteria bacterium CG07_land_8_20_14_0_80_39_15]PIZ16943.1 MAG: 50S ribosomal protein L22 [Candidatus Desantisbacteria bacterium CG_4_10_14_0_8_um_filter_39_17]
MEVKAIAKFIKGSSRKIVRVARSIHGKPIGEVLEILKFSPANASTIIEKLLKSAIANARQSNLNITNLYIKELVVQQGPMIKRFKAASRYHVRTIRKRTSHLTVVLAEKS